MDKRNTKQLPLHDQWIYIKRIGRVEFGATALRRPESAPPAQDASEAPLTQQPAQNGSIVEWQHCHGMLLR